MNALATIAAGQIQPMICLNWRPISELPADRMDGRDVLLWVQGQSEIDGSAVVGSHGQGWWSLQGELLRSITHWADLPPSPAPKQIWRTMRSLPADCKDGAEVYLFADRAVEARWLCFEWSGDACLFGRWVDAEGRTIKDPTHWASRKGPVL